MSEEDNVRDLATLDIELPEEKRPNLCVMVVAAGTTMAHPLPEEGTLLVGRAEDADLSVDDPSVSRRHAIVRTGERLTIEDLGSSNGTRVRDVRLEAGQPAEISPGDVIDLGSAMLIVQYALAAEPPRRICTHGYFAVRVEQECARARRSTGQFAIVHVRAQGTISTDAVQWAIVAQLRSADLLASYTPGEYQLLLLDSSVKEAKEVGDRIVANLPDGRTRLRFGHACYPTDARDAESLIATAAAAARGMELSDPNAEEVVIKDPAMIKLYRLADRIAVGPLSVLLVGETGVGKEVLAEYVHNQSPRADKPFLRLNCAALSESLLQSELFGHERGAFTGALKEKTGLLESANEGTVFLDEVSDMPLSTQVKLLRVIEEKKVLRVGSVRPRSIDVRFIAATNRNPEIEVSRGDFREDLYFRLNGITIAIPPLRTRVAEIESLAGIFLRRLCKQMNIKPEPRLSERAMRLLKAYSWPGNIRELRNIIERAVLLCGGEDIDPEHLPTEKMSGTLLTLPKPPARVAESTTDRPVFDDNGSTANRRLAGSAAEEMSPTESGSNAKLDELRQELELAERDRIIDALA
ncbi:sigma 54-interacting transcriptional regulator, partial [Myxococcota bacterium]